RAAQHLAAARFDGASVEIGLGLGNKSPVEHVPLVELTHAERDVDVGMPVAPAGFDQQHLGACILAQPVGEHAAGRAGADDDVVVARGRHGVGAHDPAQYGRTVPFTVVRSISRRWSEGKSSRAWLEQRLSQTRRSPTRQTWRYTNSGFSAWSKTALSSSSLSCVGISMTLMVIRRST